MAKEMNIPILGLVENMSYVECPKCHEIIYPFGDKKGEDIAQKLGIPFLNELPIDPALTKLVDEGKAEDYKGNYLKNTVKAILD